jgi:SlyX protein
MEDRLTELETKLAFTEDLVDTLNQTVIRQQAQLDLLQEQLRMLHLQLQAVQQTADPLAPRDEIPPHY